jgi:prolyl oligopeptidase
MQHETTWRRFVRAGRRLSATWTKTIRSPYPRVWKSRYMAGGLCLLCMYSVKTTLGTEPAMEGKSTITTSNRAADVSPSDPFAWLEDITGPASTNWVRQENEKTFKSLKSRPTFLASYEAALSALTAPTAGRTSEQLIDGWVYRLSKSPTQPRGLWQRMRVEQYLSASNNWQTLLDVDQLSREEGTPLSLADANTKCLETRCMLTLVPDGKIDGGGHGQREFDVETHSFVKNGFVLPEPVENKYDLPVLEWKDINTLYVVVHKPGAQAGSLGEPFIVRKWSRGTSYPKASELFRSEPPGSGGQVSGFVKVLSDGTRRETVLRYGDNSPSKTVRVTSSGELQILSPPSEFEPVGLYQSHWIFRVLTNVEAGGHTWKQDSIVSIRQDELTSSSPTVYPMLAPSPENVQPVAQATPGGVLVRTVDNVRSRLWIYKLDGNQWSRQQLSLPDYGSIDFRLTAPEADIALVGFESYLQPLTLFSVDTNTARVTRLSQRPDLFRSSDLVTEQLWASSKDGTRVPYFVVRHTALQLNGKAPTLLRAYGNGGAVQLPVYDPVLGKLWLEKGGVYVRAQIRGGGELGPAWHVTKLERRRTYEDFIAVAEDLIRRRITSPSHLGIQGHSMGGCLVGVMLNERPDLFSAAISMNGVLDQLGGYALVNGTKVFHARAPGAERMWGSLDVPEERAFLERTSPYQNLQRRADSPPPLIMTSTNDSIPAFEARKYVAKLASFSMPYFFYESPEGGHGFGVTPQQVALHDTLVYEYLAMRLKR